MTPKELKKAALLKKTILELLDDLKVNTFQGRKEEGDIADIEFYFSTLALPDVLDHCRDHILPMKKKIQKRKTSFFIENSSTIFKGLPEDKIEMFIECVSDREIFSEESEGVTFDFFDTIIGILES